MTQSTRTSQRSLPSLRVLEPVPVRDLVGQGADLPVCGAGGDDDLLVLGVAPSGRAVVGQLPELHRVAELGGVGDQRGDQGVVAVADDRL